MNVHALREQVTTTEKYITSVCVGNKSAYTQEHKFYEDSCYAY